MLRVSLLYWVYRVWVRGTFPSAIRILGLGETGTGDLNHWTKCQFVFGSRVETHSLHSLVLNCNAYELTV